ncbi:hypothetical protein [Herbidospora mongoliensis]|uniref:hypothetical protein n=1 Tax=Herbidospora mongoliensis TaxID=688067 RepID=UPI0008342307|nr:hypothetical protein [Herbidospora mongoliensis]
MAESMYVLGEGDRKKLARLIAAAWSDGGLKARYETEPRVVLREYGIDYPAGVPTPPLPAKPEGEFEIADLESAAGAASVTAGTIGEPCASCYSQGATWITGGH